MPLTVDMRESLFVKEWLAEGELAGQTKLLRELLEHRFGQLPDWAARQVAVATSGAIERRKYRVFDAKTLDEVFA